MPPDSCGGIKDNDNAKAPPMLQRSGGHYTMFTMPELLGQFSRFTGVGCMSAIGHYGLLIALVQLAGTDAVLASAAGAVLGAVINYILNYRWTFRSTRRHRESVVRFAVVAVVGLGLNTLFMWIGVDLLRLHYLPAQILTTILVLLWSFSANRLWTFGTGRDATAAE